MAIKGKGKTRRRTVAAGPKPVYVEPPKPLYRRRWAQLTGLGVLLVGLAIGAAAILVHQGNLHHKEQLKAARDKERAIVGQFGSQVDQSLQPVTQDFQQTKVPFPTLSQQMSSLKVSQPFPKDFVQLARSSAISARRAADTIEKIPASTLVSDHPVLLPLVDSQDFLVQSLRVYEQASQALVSASKASAGSRTALFDQAKNLLPVGANLFNSGYQRLVNVRAKLGISPPPAPPPQPSPPATAPPPSPSASPSATASGGKHRGKGSKKSGAKSGNK
jgi:hypothetical protein